MSRQPGIISGRVCSSDGQPVANAQLFFKEGPEPLPEIAALTNDDGTFSLTAPQSGKYVIQCVAIGFVEESVTVSVAAGKTATVTIELKREK